MNLRKRTLLELLIVLALMACEEAVEETGEQEPTAWFQIEAISNAPAGTTWKSTNTKVFVQSATVHTIVAQGTNNTTFEAVFYGELISGATFLVTTSTNRLSTVNISFTQRHTPVAGGIIDIGEPTTYWQANTADTVLIQKEQPLRILFTNVGVRPLSGGARPFFFDAFGEWR